MHDDPFEHDFDLDECVDASAAARDADDDPRPSVSLQRLIHRLGSRVLAIGTIRPLLTPLYHGWYRDCVQCGELVGADGEPYYVERALRRGEPLFEYALCERCVFALQNDLSRESIERLTAYWLQQFDPGDRWRHLGQETDPAPLVDRCLLTRTPRSELEEFQVWAWIQDGRLLADEHAPGILSAAAVEQVAEHLSQPTRERLDGFVRDCLGLPPELVNLPILI